MKTTRAVRAPALAAEPWDQTTPPSFPLSSLLFPPSPSSSPLHHTMLVPLLSTLVLAASAAAQSTTFSIALGSGPEAPALTTTAATGSWRPPQPTGGLPPASLSGMGRQMYINSANE